MAVDHGERDDEEEVALADGDTLAERAADFDPETDETSTVEELREKLDL